MPRHEASYIRGDLIFRASGLSNFPLLPRGPLTKVRSHTLNTAVVGRAKSSEDIFQDHCAMDGLMLQRQALQASQPSSMKSLVKDCFLYQG